MAAREVNSNKRVIKVKHFNPNNVSYKPVVVDKRGGKRVFLTHNGGPLVLQTPHQMTWGLNEFRVDDDSPPKYSVNFRFDEQTPETDDFLQKIQDLQDKILDDAVVHSKEWFGKSKQSRVVSEALFYPLLRYPKNKDTGEEDMTRSPTMKVKVPFWEDSFNVELFDMMNNKTFGPRFSTMDTPTDLMPAGSRMTAIIQCNNLWFIGGKFGLTWTMKMAKVEPSSGLTGASCFVEDSDDESDDEVAVASASVSHVEASSPTFSDSDEEAIQLEEEPEPEPEPVKKKVTRKKRVVRRKAT